MWMIGMKNVKYGRYGLQFRNGRFERLLGPGRHWFIDLTNRVKVIEVSDKDLYLRHEELEQIVKSGLIDEAAVTVDLKDHERALVWLNGRFHAILDSGLYALWKGQREIRVEVIDARTVRFAHQALDVIAKAPGIAAVLNVFEVAEGHLGVGYLNGAYAETLKPGRYATWNRSGNYKLYHVDLREKVLDVAGQEIMTADKVTLRMNAVVTYRVVDARKSVEGVADADQALYREAQQALRAEIGTRELDVVLADKDVVALALEKALRARAEGFGLRVISLGIRDLILPGDMKELLNQVIEARKRAEATVIQRREETAAMRSQANTARLLADNPTLMRLRELEVLQHVASNAQLNVLVGEKGLTDKVMNLL